MAAGVLVVVASVAVSSPGWGLYSHVDCRLGAPAGNITVWNLAAIVAAPYLGSESGSVTIWGETPAERSSLSQDTVVLNGNVTVYYALYSNLTIYPLTNTSSLGPGVSASCLSAYVAYFSPNPAQGLRSGGVTWWPLSADEPPNDTGLPTQLNGSQLCAAVENSTYAGCAVGAEFDMNFRYATGSVNTCGSSQSQVLQIRSESWPVDVPFSLGGQVHTVPIDPSGANGRGYANGTYAWYNYTFPADGGIWQYDNLAETSSTGAGLVFSYAPCP